jgi:hypothetical protein
LVTGCISTKKYNSYVYAYKGWVRASRGNSGGSVIVKTDSLIKEDTLVRSKKNSSLFIPALLYWQWDNTIRCDLNPSIGSNILETSIEAYSDSIKLNEKLNGQVLELSIRSVPVSFVWTHYGYCVIFIFGYTYREHKGILPVKGTMVVDYRLFKNNQVIKNGSVTIENNNHIFGMVSSSTKKYTWYYLDQYNRIITDMGQTLIDRILTEI